MPTVHPAEPCWIMLFDSIHHVLAAEQVFQQRAVWCDLVPVPRNLHSDCGMAVAFRAADWIAVQAFLTDPRLGRRSIFRPAEGGFVEIVATGPSPSPSGRGLG